jgi:hypothetical protein
MKPFESNRLNLVMVYLLGFSKVATVALSSAFDERFRLSRILTTVIGVIIIVIQGILTICLMIAIVMGAISSYMSLTRYRSEMKPKSWQPLRNRYFVHVDLKATDQPAPPPPAPPTPESPKEPYFSVTAVRREPKIEDEDPNDLESEEQLPQSRVSLEQAGETHPSRTMSMRSRASTSMSNLPYGARKHRASWSIRDLQNVNVEQSTQPGLGARMSMESMQDANRHRTGSLRGPSRNGLETSDASFAVATDMNTPQSPKRGHRRVVSSPTNSSKGRGLLTEDEKENDTPTVRERTNEI